MSIKIKQIQNLILFVVVLTGCDLLRQNDFVETIRIGSDDDEKIYCDVYQTGIDNYRYEFKKITEDSDTIKIFHAYLNDAINGNEKFELMRKGDTIEIANSKPMTCEPKEIDKKIYLPTRKK